MGGEASLTSFCLPCTPGGQLSCSAPEGREAAEREGLRKLENHPGVRTLASWYFGTGHRKLKFGKEGLCLVHLFEAGLGLSLSHLTLEYFSLLISHGLVLFAVWNLFGFPTEIHSHLAKSWQLE